VGRRAVAIELAIRDTRQTPALPAVDRPSFRTMSSRPLSYRFRFGRFHTSRGICGICGICGISRTRAPHLIHLTRGDPPLRRTRRSPSFPLEPRGVNSRSRTPTRGRITVAGSVDARSHTIRCHVEPSPAAARSQRQCVTTLTDTDGSLCWGCTIAP